MAANEEATEALASTHRLKLKPPTYDGNYAIYEEWTYKSEPTWTYKTTSTQICCQEQTVLTDAELAGTSFLCLLTSLWKILWWILSSSWTYLLNPFVRLKTLIA